MNIIDFLLLDHQRLCHDRVEIRKTLSEGLFLLEKLKKYISDLELHETMEHYFLIAKLQEIPGREKLDGLIATYEKEHKEIWEFIGQLSQSVNSLEASSVQQVFFKFFAFVEAHVGVEERSFFPTIRKLVDDKTLKELGRSAEKYYDRYHQTEGK